MRGLEAHTPNNNDSTRTLSFVNKLQRLKMMRSVTAAICRPAVLRRSRPIVLTSKLFSSDSSSSSSSSSSSYNAESAARTLKLLERRKVSTIDIGIFKRKKKPITMVTAYDFPSAVHVDLAGFDILLVGDSLGMVELVRAPAVEKLEIGT